MSEKLDQKQVNAEVNAIVALGWQLQGTAASSEGPTFLGKRMTFTFVRPS